MRYDFLVFLAYIYDEDSAEPLRQLAFANELLGIRLTMQEFLNFRKENCLDPDFLTKVPDSLKYFVKDDLMPESRRSDSGISISRFVVNTFRDLGQAFIAFGGISDQEIQTLTDYMNMMNDFLKSYGLFYAKDPLRMGQKGDPAYGMPRYARPKPRPDATVDMSTAASYYEEDPVPVSRSGGTKTPGRGADVPGRTGNSATSEKRGPVSEREEKNRNAMGIQEKAKQPQTEGDLPEEKLEDLMDELDKLIGLERVKKNLNNLINVIRIRKLREKMGLAQPDMSLHLVFSGNPGTGKTTVARLLAKIYKALGVVSKGQLVEVDRAGLVEGYVGQTAQKTTEVIDSALGGVLFIDEAYTLTNKKESGDYGQEAVDTLLKRMEDDRDSFVVIAAGYTEPMEEFLESNPGLRSRFSKFVDFDDYTADELYEIFTSMCSAQDFHMTEEADAVVKEHFEKMVEDKDDNFANAREVRNFFERCIERQANRLVREEKIEFSQITTFTEDDVKE